MESACKQAIFNFACTTSNPVPRFCMVGRALPRARVFLSSARDPNAAEPERLPVHYNSLARRIRGFLLLFHAPVCVWCVWVSVFVYLSVSWRLEVFEEMVCFPYSSYAFIIYGHYARTCLWKLIYTSIFHFFENNDNSNEVFILY